VTAIKDAFRNAQAANSQSSSAGVPPLATVPVVRKSIETPAYCPLTMDMRLSILELTACASSRPTSNEQKRGATELLKDKGRMCGLPGEIQRLLYDHLAARLRALQGRTDGRDIPNLMARICRQAKEIRCGYVYGLSHAHRPKTASWDADADERRQDLYRRALTDEHGAFNQERLLGIVRAVVSDAAPFDEIRPLLTFGLQLGMDGSDRRLARLCAPFFAEMGKDAELKPLRLAVKKFERADARESKDESEPPPVPSDWPWLAVTKGKRAILVGGEPREPNRKRIERAFGFARLDWARTERNNHSVRSVQESVGSRGADLVVILTDFMGHPTYDQVTRSCDLAGTPWISIHGYGIARIKLEIERRIPRPA
jgi:hypothetical protein